MKIMMMKIMRKTMMILKRIFNKKLLIILTLLIFNISTTLSQYNSKYNDFLEEILHNSNFIGSNITEFMFYHKDKKCFFDSNNNRFLVYDKILFIYYLDKDNLVIETILVVLTDEELVNLLKLHFFINGKLIGNSKNNYLLKNYKYHFFKEKNFTHLYIVPK